MNKQLSQLFDRFYTIAIKDKIQDPLLHSQWNYFQSMLSSTNFERDRINMYLSILEKQKRKKQAITDFQYNSIATYNDIKLEKRFSEPSKNLVREPNIGGPFSTPDEPESDAKKLSTPKAKEGFRKISGGWDSKEKSQNCSTSKSKGLDDKPNFRRLQDIAHNLVRMFEVSVVD